ncbi:hypothetical protein LR48_Vigan588s000300 [Vigna angularis]|nr:zinc finger protein ZAT5 [Vigna angularis]KAG2401915.1 Zinc finger protein [Vigna angularis]KOM28795.1 hypothetical protein LR48_Vigan588s000300 [Vigna angularis]
MEAPEELSLGGSKDHANIVKGKRTKRVRPQSPIPFSVTANSSTGEGEREDCCNVDDNTNTNTNKNYDINNNNIIVNNINNNNNSPTTSSAGLQDSTDEEEDMANCLILLAQGQSRESPKHVEEDVGMNYAKYSSRKFLEAATLGSSRAGYYVYECKTCNRTFPSFQALGGHRASHKKLKAIVPIPQEKKHQHLLSSDEDDFQLKPNNKSPFSLQLGTKASLYNKSKVHECSICGAEFTSGQALGGHMRRHRAPVGIPTTLSFTPLTLEPEEDHPRKKRNVLNLELDLNLPAPEDDQRESKFSFASKQQQQQQHGQKKQQQQQQQQQQPQTSLVLTAPALVDCHY